MATQSQIKQVLQTGAIVTKNPNDAFQIETEFNALDRSKNYCWMFKKTQNHWTESDWSVVARDVQQQLNNRK